jgi:hypothetical protein
MNRIGAHALALAGLCGALGGAATGALGCAATGASELGPQLPDQPIPASEPRAELALRVDLPASRECEEALDLELYRNRAIELVRWDEKHGSCEGRRIVVRYLSRQLGAEQALALVRQHCSRASVVEEQAKSHGAPPKK